MSNGSQDVTKEIHKERHAFEYAWRYFALHAEQRTSMFNFFLVGVGILANAYATLISDKLYFPAAGAAFTGIIFSIGFLMLDRRNSYLVKRSEDVLEWLEMDFMFEGEDEIKIIDKNDNEKKPKAIKAGIIRREKLGEDQSFVQRHSFLIPAIEGITAIIFISALVYAL